MPTKAQEDLSTVWQEKIRDAESYYKKWEQRYNVKLLEDFEEGFQTRNNEYETYVLNLFYTTIEIKTPSIVFRKPTVTLKPTPRALATDSEGAFLFARNNEDLINTWLLDPDNNFSTEILTAIDDSWSRFGIIEIGYSTNWIDNPKLKKPKIASDYRPGVDKRSQKVVRSRPEKIPSGERVYVKNIPAKDFLVSTSNSNELHQCDWVGYSELVRLEDILASGIFINKEEIESGRRSTLYSTDSEQYHNLLSSNVEIVLIRKIWDLRASRKYILAPVVIYNQPFSIFPLYDLRFKRRKKSKGFLPLPVTFNWISPQVEINEVRQAHSHHRRAMKRIYLANKSRLDDESELEKLIYGPDGSVIWTTGDNAVMPVQNADLGRSAEITLQTPFDDFNRVAGTTSEMRAEIDRQTATASRISNTRAALRESKERDSVAEFIQRILKGVLLIFRNNFVNPLPVQRPAEEGFLGNVSNDTIVENIDPLFDLGDDTFDFLVMLQISSMSPVAGEEEKTKFIEFITLLSQFPQFAMSPTLIRELAFRTGYFNEKVINEFQQLAQLQLTGILQQLGVQIPESGLVNNTAKQMQPPDEEQIRNQIVNQGA